MIKEKILSNIHKRIETAVNVNDSILSDIDTHLSFIGDDGVFYRALCNRFNKYGMSVGMWNSTHTDLPYIIDNDSEFRVTTNGGNADVTKKGLSSVSYAIELIYLELMNFGNYDYIGGPDVCVYGRGNVGKDVINSKILNTCKSMYVRTSKSNIDHCTNNIDVMICTNAVIGDNIRKFNDIELGAKVLIDCGMDYKGAIWDNSSFCGDVYDARFIGQLCTSIILINTIERLSGKFYDGTRYRNNNNVY